MINQISVINWAFCVYHSELLVKKSLFVTENANELNPFFFVAPPAPSFRALREIDVTENRILLRWNPPNRGADSYELSYSTPSGAGQTFTVSTRCRYQLSCETSKQKSDENFSEE